ncbi:MAG: diguanylate cyclase [Gammaproteobacteria bacterium]|nr:diguanylate cyclase [Gammaproteobacteria bacterium]
MQIKSLANYSALFLIVVATCVISGWLFHIPAFIQIQTGMVGMVMNSALNFLLLGLVILLYKQNTIFFSILKKTLLIIILLISIASFSQDFFHYSNGMDQLLIKPWLIDLNPTPGRMAPNTAIGFMVSAILGFIIPFGKRKFIASTIHILTLAIFLIAIIGLLVYVLKLELILKWYSYTRMAIPTVICFIAVSLGWCGVWSQTAWEQKFYENKEDQKIIFITGVILITLIIIAGLSSLAGLAYINISAVNAALQDSLQKKITFFDGEITDSQRKALSVMTNLILLNAIEKQNTEQIGLFMESLQKQGFTAIAIKNSQGKILDATGVFHQSQSFSAPLKTLKGNATLFWRNGFWIKLDLPISSKNQSVIGYFSGELPLSYIDKLFHDYSGLGATGEIGLCYSNKENSAACFPTRQKLVPFNVTLAGQGKTLPMTYALAGKKGSLTAFDYLGKSVIAAYGPINDTGLGMVVKIQTSEIYQPLHNELILNSIIAFALGLLGLLIIRWQITPLVHKVVSSEKETHHANKKLESMIIKLNHKNQEISLLRDLSESLQSCLSMTEAFPIIQELGRKILPDVSAVLYLIHASRNYLESELSWGNPKLTKKIMKPEDCWALRRGVTYQVNNAMHGVNCPHLIGVEDKSFFYTCIPLFAQSDVLGLLYIEKPLKPPLLTNETEEDDFVASALGEQIALGLSNIRLREILKTQSISDPLSGLYNRRYLEETFSREIRRAKSNKTEISVLMIDIDHFKQFNDQWGHDAGDIIIREFGELLHGFVHAGDMACRYGGEEFIVVLPETSSEKADNRAAVLHQLVSQLNLYYGSSLLSKFTISIGIATYPKHGLTIQEIITSADLALYKAKMQGRDMTVVYHAVIE